MKIPRGSRCSRIISTVRSTAPRFSRTTFSAFRPSSARRALVREQFAQRILQLLGVARLDRRLLREKTARDIREILHVRPENHRPAQRARLDGILPAHRRQTFADEHDRRVLVKITQLARRVDEQTFHFACAEPRRPGQFRCDKIIFTSRVAQLASEFAAALEMARHQHEKQFRKPRRAAAAQFPPG